MAYGALDLNLFLSGFLTCHISWKGRVGGPQVLQQNSPCLGRLSCCFPSCFEVVLSKGEAEGGEPTPVPSSWEMMRGDPKSHRLGVSHLSGPKTLHLAREGERERRTHVHACAI